MEAKETVMSEREIDKILSDWFGKQRDPYPALNPYLHLVMCQAQAEISFPLGEKQGFKAGIREVVEWLRQYAIHGSKVPLEVVLVDLEAHSPYGKPSSRTGEYNE